MNLLPVIHRELLSEARRPSNVYLRVCSVLAALVVALMSAAAGAWQPGYGGIQFFWIHQIIFVLIWFMVPIMAADCISREHREGTLGLLFLTPLNPASVVVAKVVVHGIRGASLLLAILPVMVLPLLQGGLRGMDVFYALVLDVSALCFALSAALIASATSRHAVRAMLTATFIATVFCVSFLLLNSFLLTGWFWDWQQAWVLANAGGGNGIGIRTGPVPTIWGAPPWTRGFAMVAVGALVLVLSVAYAARRIRGIWQDPGMSRLQGWAYRTFCTPRFLVGHFQRTMVAALDRNPIGWLQQYSWSARLVKWSWCCGLMLYGGLFIMEATWFELLVVPALLGTTAIAFTASNSFAKERQTGALELLLVTPLSVSQIICGRLSGILGQFLPFSLLWGLLLLAISGYWRQEAWGSLAAAFASSYLSLAVIGLANSIRGWHFMLNWILTWSTGMLVPGAITLIIRLEAPSWDPAMIFCALQLSIAGWKWSSLLLRLGQRQFALA